MTMQIRKLIQLPWRLREVVRSIRRELAEVRAALDDLRRAASPAAQERLLAEIREQGLMIEAAVRASSRSAAECKLRERLGIASSREPGVSVLVPCWNHVGYLERAVASAISTLEVLPVPGEVIILDDASRDGSRELAEELAQTDVRIRQIASTENLGLPRARNVLLGQARYEHAMILDSDNELIPSGIVQLYESALQTGAALTHGNIVRVDQDGAVLDVMDCGPLTPEILKRNWIDAMSLVRTGRLLELGGYDPQWLYGLEDWELNQRLFSLGEAVVYVPVLVGKYRTLPDSMIHEAPLDQRCRRASRIFGSVSASRLTAYRAAMHHPALGMVWSSPSWPGSPSMPQLREKQPETRPRALVVSSGGVLNYGDDAILLSTLQRLQRIWPGVLADVITDGAHCPPLGRLAQRIGSCEEFACGLNPEWIQHGCGDDRHSVDELSRWLDLDSGHRTDVSGYDIILIAGGGNLNSYWPALIARRAAVAAAAKAAAIPYILTGQGVGPLSPEIVPLLSLLIHGASAVATRDPGSVQLLRQSVWKGPQIAMVGDDALGLRCESPEAVRERLSQIGVPPDRPLLAFQARTAADYVGFNRDEIEGTALKLDAFAARHGFDIVCVPINMQPHATELELLVQLASHPARRASWHVVDPQGDVAVIAGVIKSCQAVASHSYHAAVFALEARVPTLLFAGTEYYRLKAEALRTGFGSPVPILAEPEIGVEEMARRLRAMAEGTWGRGMTSEDVDSWLLHVLSPCCPGLVAPGEGSAGSSWALAG